MDSHNGVMFGDDSPCGSGHYLAGDICEPKPAGYVETRSECEIAIDSREAAGVIQDYPAEIERCRQGAGIVPDGEGPANFFEVIVDLLFVEIPGTVTEILMSLSGA